MLMTQNTADVSVLLSFSLKKKKEKENLKASRCNTKRASERTAPDMADSLDTTGNWLMDVSLPNELTLFSETIF